MKSLHTATLCTIIIFLFSGCQTDNVRLHLIGDSTMADYEENTTEKRGWGEMFSQVLPKGVTVINRAIPGRSSRSYYDEGSWQKTLEDVMPGDYVLIQFAHNDEKEQGKDGEDGCGTAPWTTYRNYLRKYIDETRAKGAEPILIQPIVRRYFEGNSITPRGRHNLSSTADDTTIDYTAAMLNVAKEKKVPIIDLCDKSRKIVEAYGPVLSKEELFVSTDNTHTSAKGASVFAITAAELLDTLNLWGSSLPCLEIITNPASFDFGDVFVGDTVVKCFDAIDMHGFCASAHRVLTHNCEMAIEAPKGFKVAHNISGEKKDTIILRTSSETNFIVFYTPTDGNETKGKIRITTEDSKADIFVRGNVKKINKTTKETIEWPYIRKQVKADNVDIKLSTIKGLKMTNDHFMPFDEVWSADIDETGQRFIQIKVSAKENAVKLNHITFNCTDNMCYRLSYAWGNDFFNRVVIGERIIDSATPETSMIRQVKATKADANESMHKDSYATSISIRPNECVLLRIHPWSPTEKEGAFVVNNIEFVCTTIE